MHGFYSLKLIKFGEYDHQIWLNLVNTITKFSIFAKNQL